VPTGLLGSSSAGDQHRTWCQAHHLLGHTAQEQVCQTRVAMRAHHNEVHFLVARGVNNALKWRPGLHENGAVQPGILHALAVGLHPALRVCLEFFDVGVWNLGGRKGCAPI
jgi:hypothetical protein